jgi:hypothetical protein
LVDIAGLRLRALGGTTGRDRKTGTSGASSERCGLEASYAFACLRSRGTPSPSDRKRENEQRFAPVVSRMYFAPYAPVCRARCSRCDVRPGIRRHTSRQMVAVHRPRASPWTRRVASVRWRLLHRVLRGAWCVPLHRGRLHPRPVLRRPHARRCCGVRPRSILARRHPSPGQREPGSIGQRAFRSRVGDPPRERPTMCVLRRRCHER